MGEWEGGEWGTRNEEWMREKMRGNRGQGD